MSFKALSFFSNKGIIFFQQYKYMAKNKTQQKINTTKSAHYKNNVKG